MSMTSQEREDALLATEIARCRALSEADLPTLRVILAEDLIYIHSSGRREGKALFLSSLEIGALIYGSIDQRDLRSTIAGDVAWIEEELRFAIRLNGVMSEKHVRALSVWRLESNRWRMAACANVPIIVPPSANALSHFIN
jgi:ketosteroid isomerase-like protein